MLLCVGLVLFAYLIGSIASAVVVCRLLGAADPRSAGSRNPGATNVLRVAGKGPAALTLVADLLKGLVPTLLAKSLGVSQGVLALTATAAFLGHLYPVFFAFRGGKGVATLLGVLLAIGWPLGLCFAMVWLAMAVIFRISSLAALTAAPVTLAAAWALAYPPAVLAALGFMLALLYYRHRANLRNLLAGREPRLGAR